ncbi:DUF106 domain-containing protein [Candidatus Woesearchaeota archaeon]|nr:DUF106 domain-containing protein [Candidatus Woesearchaeota archaeon]
MGIISTILDPVLGPVFILPPVVGILLTSFVLSLVSILIYKYATDQSLMKQLKDEMKELQNEIKTLRHDPQKAMEVQKRAMETNMKYMTKSLKPTLITLIPFFIIFGWLSANLSLTPIMPGQEFALTVQAQSGELSVKTSEGMTVLGDAAKNLTDSKAVFTLKGEKGKHVINVEQEGKTYPVEVTITDAKIAPMPVVKGLDKTVTGITTGQDKLIILPLYVFNWKLGWLGTYLILSILFSIVLRKALKIY